ncbi:TRAP transporter large permease [Salipaludibacillus aurantiacus]|uniref:C4-dicarboxylate transporter, DctM subunit n=1 Tax=Salipaludibacillus aurantiacus TaxID=1601833 RepID=A0A1H9W5Y4_9BACI|nr:TRAP transporter large permease [Salipaludibacillus aurantiacus]SES29370.1 C4-dicarboxylate transporter, DctM subunit [Salipaludibacillus aurantiacus]
MTAALMLAVILLMLALGVPIAFALGVTALAFLLLLTDLPMSLLVQQLYQGTNSFPLLAIPLFILAGSLMNCSGMSHRLINFALSIVGMFKGGLAFVNVLASVFFGAITGTAAAASAAVGQIMIPAMNKKGYAPGFSAATTSAGSSLGILIPPSVPMILYGSISGISVASLFLTGIPIGLMIAFGYLIVAYLVSLKNDYGFEEKAFSWRYLYKTFIDAIPALLVPGVILGGIMTGVVTPTESAALAVLCGLFAGAIYKELSWKNLIKALEDSVRNTALVMFIVATATILGFSFSSLGIGRQMMEPFMAYSDNPIMIMLMASLILFIGGLIFDGTVMVVVLVPLFLPLVQMTNIDPLQFAMVVIIVWGIGQQTPPVASGLYITTAIAKVSMFEASKYNIWYITVLIIALFGMIFYPDIMLYFPRLLIQ